MSVVEVAEASVRYRLSHNSTPSLKDFVLRAGRSGLRHEDFVALRDVTFTVDPGEVLGVVGHNGAGKSTLLKLLARVLPPQSGHVVVRGSCAPMIELGTGFDHEMTGVENALIYGAMLGRDPDAVRERIPEIISWAALEEFADVPLRSYSSGMIARLAFSVATDVPSDVLLVDELFSVGDADFRLRSERRMRRMIADGSAMIVVSHAMDTLEEVADRVLWLDHGQVRMLGPTHEVLAERAQVVSDADRHTSG